MSKQSKRKSKKKKHLVAEPYFLGVDKDNMPHSSGFSPHGAKGNKPIIRRTTSK